MILNNSIYVYVNLYYMANIRLNNWIFMFMLSCVCQSEVYVYLYYVGTIRIDNSILCFM